MATAGGLAATYAATIDGSRHPTHGRGEDRGYDKHRLIRRQSTMPEEPTFGEDTNVEYVLEEMTKNMHKNTKTLRKILAFLDKSQPEAEEALETDPLKKRKNRTYVEIMTAFLSIEDIHTLKQQFIAEVIIQAKWEEPRIKEFDLTDKQWKTFDYAGKFWTPKLEVLNVIDDPISKNEWYTHSMDDPGYNNPVIIYKMKLKAAFSEPLELEYFPIDSQELNVQIASQRSEDKVILVEEQSQQSYVNVANFMDKQEFSIYNCVETSSTSTEQSEFEGSRKNHSQLNVTCYVARRPNFYVWNILIVMFMIVTLSFTCFSIAGNLSASRLVISLTLLLTVIAFKFVVSHHIPQVSYLTYLEIYILAQLVFLVLVSVQNAVIAWIWVHKNQATADLADYICIGIFGGYYFFFHLIGLIYLLARRHILTRELIGKEKRYAELKTELDRYRNFPKGRTNANFRQQNAYQGQLMNGRTRVSPL